MRVRALKEAAQRTDDQKSKWLAEGEGHHRNGYHCDGPLTLSSKEQALLFVDGFGHGRVLHVRIKPVEHFI